MTNIDYEALGEVAWEHGIETKPWKGSPDAQVRNWSGVARAVVAALGDQGLVVGPDPVASHNVRSWDIAVLLHQAMAAQWGSHVPVARDGDWTQLSDAAMQGYHDISVRLVAALVAAPEE